MIPVSAHIAAAGVGVRLIEVGDDVLQQCVHCDRFSLRPVDVARYQPVPCGRCVKGRK